MICLKLIVIIIFNYILLFTSHLSLSLQWALNIVGSLKNNVAVLMSCECCRKYENMKQCKSGEVPLLIHWGNGPYITPHHHHNPPTHIYIKTSPKLMLNLNIMWNMISKQCIAMDYLWRTTTIIIHKPTLLKT